MVLYIWSTPKMNTDIMIEKTTTIMVLSISSFWVGQETFLNSFTTPSKKSLILLISFILSARVERLELPTPGFGDQCSAN